MASRESVRAWPCMLLPGAQAHAAGGHDASKRQAILLLMFARAPDGGHLVYDRNTVIPTQDK